MYPDALILMSITWAVILGVTIFCLWRICAEQTGAQRATKRLPKLNPDAKP